MSGLFSGPSSKSSWAIAPAGACEPGYAGLSDRALLLVERARQLRPSGSHLPQGNAGFPGARRPRKRQAALGIVDVFIPSRHARLHGGGAGDPGFFGRPPKKSPGMEAGAGSFGHPRGHRRQPKTANRECRISDIAVKAKSRLSPSRFSLRAQGASTSETRSASTFSRRSPAPPSRNRTLRLGRARLRPRCVPRAAR
jgi:hypothetical protein